MQKHSIIKLPYGYSKKLKIVAKSKGHTTMRGYLKNHIDKSYDKVPENLK